MKPIDAGALKDNLTDIYGDENRLVCLKDVLGLIDEQPTAANQNNPIRCKDCIYDGLTDCPLCYIEKRTLTWINHDPDFFCGKAGEKGKPTMISTNKAVEAAQTITDFCRQQKSCQNCIFRLYGS